MGSCKRCRKPVPDGKSFCPECRAEVQRQSAAEGDLSEPLQARSNSPVVNRYQDAYRVGGALVGLGNGIKILGAILGGLIVLGSVFSANNQLSGGGVALGGVFLGIAVGVLFWVCGVIVAAQGQILRATLDTAVASSRFLTDSDRADAMGLPRSIMDRPIS